MGNESNSYSNQVLIGEKKFLDLLNNIPNIAVHGYNRDGRVIYWNEGAKNIYGYEFAEALGKPITDLIIPKVIQMEIKTAIDNWFENNVAIEPMEIPLHRKDNSTVYVYSSYIMLQDNGENCELYCIDIDMTTVKQQDKIIKEKEELFFHQSKMASFSYLHPCKRHEAQR